MAKDIIKCVTPVGRCSFPTLSEPKAFGESEPKYSVQILFDKKTDLKVLKDAVRSAIEQKWGSKPPKKLDLPFKDGNDKEDLDGYADMTFINAASKFAPTLLDKNKNEIMDPSDIYAGCFVRASVNCYAWDYINPKTKTVIKSGVSFSLNAVQFVKDGEKFSKRGNAAEDFDDDLADDGSNDASNYDDEDLMGI